MTPQAPDPAVLAFLRLRVESAFSIAEKHFEHRPFVLGDRPTIVDFSMAGYVYYPATETGFDIAAEYPAMLGVGTLRRCPAGSRLTNSCRLVHFFRYGRLKLKFSAYTG